MSSDEEVRLKLENANLRELLTQAGLDAVQHEVADKLQRLILEEMHHRVKNTLSIVLAIANQSLRSATNIRSAQEAIGGRILALGRAHDLLLQSNGTSAHLDGLLKTATQPFDTGKGQFNIQTVDLEISAGAALPLIMAIHELCTNATKYGALAKQGGQVHIVTQVKPREAQFRLTWTESGGPRVRPPKRRGFGTQLIEFGSASQLSGAAKLAFRPAGLFCELQFPMPEIQAPHSNRLAVG